MNKELAELGLQLDVKEYFTYHPPLTEERKQAHQIINNNSQEVALALLNLGKRHFEIKSQENSQERKNQRALANQLIKSTIEGYETTLNILVKDELCLEYIQFTINKLKESFLWMDDEIDLKKNILMRVQQARMFANQGVTLDEILSQNQQADPAHALVCPEQRPE